MVARIPGFKTLTARGRKRGQNEQWCTPIGVRPQLSPVDFGD